LGFGSLSEKLQHSALASVRKAALTRVAKQPAATFRAKVIAAVRRIPPGRVATYGDVAAAAGSPRASRAVGNIMRGCTSAGVPCHRVIAAGGQLGGFGGNLQLKRELLRAEGILVSGRRVKDFNARRYFSHRKAKRS
jgi:O-6-methylguanine DNA methyltransferase